MQNSINTTLPKVEKSESVSIDPFVSDIYPAAHFFPEEFGQDQT